MFGANSKQFGFSPPDSSPDAGGAVIDPTILPAPGAENTLGLNSDDDTLAKVIQKLSDYIDNDVADSFLAGVYYAGDNTDLLDIVTNVVTDPAVTVTLYDMVFEFEKANGDKQFVLVPMDKLMDATGKISQPSSEAEGTVLTTDSTGNAAQWQLPSPVLSSVVLVTDANLAQIQLVIPTITVGSLVFEFDQLGLINYEIIDLVGQLPAGPAGPQGEQGLQGEQGPQGVQGEIGPAGADGLDGANGLSAYEIALSQGFVGTEAEFISSLKGEQGDQGIQGIQGVQGVQGIQGIQGLKGDPLAVQIVKNEITAVSIQNPNDNQDFDLGLGAGAIEAQITPLTDNAHMRITVTWVGGIRNTEDYMFGLKKDGIRQHGNNNDFSGEIVPSTARRNDNLSLSTFTYSTVIVGSTAGVPITFSIYGHTNNAGTTYTNRARNASGPTGVSQMIVEEIVI